MDHSDRRFGERNWSSQQEQEQHFQNFMRQNDPNRQDTTPMPSHPNRQEIDPMLSPQSFRTRNTRASDTEVSRLDMHSPFSSVSGHRRRNTYDPSAVPMQGNAYSISARSRTPPRPKVPSQSQSGLDADDDLDDLLDDENDDLLSLSEPSEEEEESTDQKPAAVQMQQVPGGIDVPVIGGPYASMVRDHRESTIGGQATSFPRNEDRWHSGGAPTRGYSPNNTPANGALPTPIAVPPPKPNYFPLEPSMPASRLGRRCLIHKPKREADLVKGLVNAGATGSKRSRDTIVVNCEKCGAELSVSRMAIAVSCPSCYKISPAAKCPTSSTMENDS
ncbi:MAG: hypothetical protein SGBAC_005928 [Bacillariaceae sp.]